MVNVDDLDLPTSHPRVPQPVRSLLKQDLILLHQAETYLYRADMGVGVLGWVEVKKGIRANNILPC